MIDRLEELLEQVEDTDEEGESLTLPRGVRLPKVPEGQASAESDDPLSAGETSGQTPLTRQEDAGESGLFSPLGELTYEASLSGLEMLHRRLRSSRDAGSARAGSVAVVRESIEPPAAGLTAGELDRALRRDSRRYDGGMTIY